ncbi:MAG: DUF2461 domain-containing protein [Polyangiaceae bacterium]
MAAAKQTFTGFPETTGKFFKALAKNQSREWFAEHKAEYEEKWVEPMKALLADVAVRIDDAYSYCELEEPKVFRIHRDVRFSKDKTPYKTSISGMIGIKSGAAGMMEHTVAVYVQLGLEEGKMSEFAGAGHYMFSPEKLAKFRQAVVTQEKELSKLLKSLEKKGFGVDAKESLTRVPKGFDPEHPLAHILKMKGLVTRFPPLPAIGEAALVTWLVKHAKAVAELVTWTTYATA